MSEWTQAHVDQLKALKAEGLSVVQIAERMGLTKGAISGRMFRAGLCVPVAVLRIKRKAVRGDGGVITRIKCRRRDEVKRKGKQDLFHERAEAPHDRRTRSSPGRESKVAEPKDTPPVNSGVTLLELTNETCRWPLGEPTHPDFRFCGKPEADSVNRRPYCAAHERMSRCVVSS